MTHDIYAAATAGRGSGYGLPMAPTKLMSDDNVLTFTRTIDTTLSYLKFVNDVLNIHETSFYVNDNKDPLFLVTEKPYSITDEYSDLWLPRDFKADVEYDIFFCRKHQVVLTTKKGFAIFLCFCLLANKQTYSWFLSNHDKQTYSWFLSNHDYVVDEEVLFYDPLKNKISSDVKVVGLPGDSTIITIRYNKKNKKVPVVQLLKKNFRIPIHLAEQIFPF